MSSFAAVREFVMLVEESSLNTPVASPVVWPTSSPNAYYVKLTDGQFAGYARPQILEIPYGGGFAVTSEAVSDKYDAVGQLKTKLYPSMAQFLLGWALTRNDGTNPWTTSEPLGDLASVSLYHAVQRSDGSYKRKLYSGTKVAGFTLEVSADSTVPVITLDLVASKCQGNSMDGSNDPTSSTFPVPTESQYPSGPYRFVQTAGGLVIATSGSTPRTKYKSITLKVQNALDSEWYETPYKQVIRACGRSTTLETKLFLQPTPDDRSNYEAVAVHGASLVFNTGVTGTNLILELNSQNTIMDLPYDLPVDKAYETTLALKNRWDPAANAGAGGDISFSLM